MAYTKNLNATYSVYGLVDPRTNEYFYIGKGIKNRVLCHYRKGSLQKRSHKNSTIKAYRALGLKDEYNIISDNLCNDLAIMLEIYLISYLGRLDNNEGFLTNNTDGGESPPIGKDHPSFKAMSEGKPWFNGIYSNFYNRKPWKHNKGNLNFWSNIQVVESLYKLNPEYKEMKLRNLLHKNTGIDFPVKPFYKALKMLKSGWCSNEDIEWIQFKNEYGR